MNCCLIVSVNSVDRGKMSNPKGIGLKHCAKVVDRKAVLIDWKDKDE